MSYLESLANEIPWIMAPAALIAVLIAISSLYKLLIQQKDPVIKIMIVTIIIVVALGTTMMKYVFM